MRNATDRRTFMRANAWLCTAVALTFGSFYLAPGVRAQMNSGAGSGGHSSSAGSHSSGAHASGGLGSGRPSRGYSGARSYGYSQNSSQNPYGPTRPSFELPGTSHPTIELPGNPLQTSPARGSRRQYGYRAGILPWGYDAGFYPGYINTGVPYGYDDEQQDMQAQGPQGGGPAYGQGQAQAYASPENGPAGPEPPYGVDTYGGSAYGEARPPYGAPNYANAAPENTGPVTDGLEHPEITLIFNNGQPPQTIQGYAVTKSTLFALEGTHQRKIPISELDVPATVEKNRENGVEFSVPGTPN